MGLKMARADSPATYGGGGARPSDGLLVGGIRRTQYRNAIPQF
jgi:hypothetical protein